MMTTPVAIYGRYSTDEQDPRSIEDQFRRCTDHATTKGFEVVATFADAAISGSHTDRVELRRMLEVATATRRSPFKAVLVDDLSRLSRSIGDFWRMLDDLAGAGVRVIDVQTGMSSDDSNARSMFAMKSAFNDHFLQMVKYQTHRGLDGRARAGFSTGGSLFGYVTHAETNPSNTDHPRKIWAIDDTEAVIVRRIFDEFDRGACSFKAIAEQLNRAGIRAPRDGRRGHKIGHGWNHTSVRAILGNPKYIGTWTWNSTRWVSVPGKKTRRQLKRPESEHVTREYPELAIIDRAVWERVQAKLRKRVDKSGTLRGRPPGAGSRPYLVSGLLKCGECGGPMSIASQKTKNGVRYANFGCTAHRSRGSSVCSNATTISERKITGGLIDALRDTLNDPEVLEIFAKAFERRVNERSKASKPADLERELRAAQQRVTNATRLIVEIPDDIEIRRQREADKAEVRRLTDAIAEQCSSKPNAVPNRGAIRAAMNRFLDVVSTAGPQEGREALSRCMTALTVTPAPKNENPGLVATGGLDLRAVLANYRSGGAISRANTWQSFRIRLGGPPKTSTR